MDIQKPYLLFLGDAPDALAIKTAQGVVDWRPEWCVGQMRLEGCKATTGLEDLTIDEAIAKGAKTFVIGTVSAGGVLPDTWVSTIVAALDAGMDIASGLHKALEDFDEVREAATRNRRALHNVRKSKMSFATGKGNKRRGKRLLAVGTDCSVGKKYTALALEKEMSDRGMKSTFCATGQTGVLIAGRGVAIDAVIADFISGAAEWISPENDDPDHWDVIEGQGSLFHPSFAGVSLGLLHGSQPDAFVVCHEPTRTTMRGVQTPLPSIQDVIDSTIAMGKLNNPNITCVGLCVNTSNMPKEERAPYLENLSKEYGLPACDPIDTGVAAIIDKVQGL